jgi:hypothetical protein
MVIRQGGGVGVGRGVVVGAVRGETGEFFSESVDGCDERFVFGGEEFDFGLEGGEPRFLSLAAFESG